MQMKNKASAPRGVRGWLLRSFLILALIVTATGAIGAVVLGTLALRNLEPRLPEIDEQSAVRAGASHIYHYEFTDRTARIGHRAEQPMATLDGGVHFIPTAYADYPRALIDAVVAIEDKRFWQHHGVDFLRTGEAAINYLMRGDGRFGASTITQQLVKNLTGENDYSIRRKIQEMVWANDLENSSTKEQIMERYLNIINLSQGCYGVGAAADRFFGKTVSELSVGECAALAGITKNPSYYDPVRFPAHTLARRNVILSEMRAQGYLDEQTFRAAMDEPLALVEQRRERMPVCSWYTDMVISDVIDDLCAAYGYTREYANRLLWSGGLVIEAAVDPAVQQTVEAYYAELSHFPLHKNGERAQSGMIVIDPKTGDILAVAGAIGQKTGNRLQSHATDTRRPAASAIKPLSAYAPALEMGKITWASVFDDVPVEFHKGKSGKQTVAWPKNANRVYRGLTDVRYAVSHSVNTVAVRVLREIGIGRSFDFLHDTLGMSHLIDVQTTADGRTLSDRGEAALALGQMHYGVTLRELTAGYTALANGGIYMKPRSYFRVLAPDGRILLSNDLQGNYALSEQNAAIMTELLQTVVTQGTGKGAELAGGRIAVAGKTGTSNADQDRYFIGYTPEYLAGVWYGFDYPAPLSDIKGNVAVRIWHDVMSEVTRPALRAGKAKSRFDLPSGLVRISYCRDSGKLPTDACRADLRGDRCTEGYFVQGSEPKGYCDCHVLRDYDSERQGVATAETPPEHIRRAGFLRLKRKLPRRVYVLDERYALTS